jgi:antitoxin HicB
MRFAWPVELLEEREGITITCPDVPEMVTCAATLDTAMEDAVDALVTALSFYTDAGRRLPTPSPARGRRVVAVPAPAAAKLALHQAMLDAGVSNVELGRRLAIDEKAVRRLRDPLHRSKVETIEAALRALGPRLEVVVRPAA